jgi:hypothetical protein
VAGAFYLSDRSCHEPLLSGGAPDAVGPLAALPDCSLISQARWLRNGSSDDLLVERRLFVATVLARVIYE